MIRQQPFCLIGRFGGSETDVDGGVVSEHARGADQSANPVAPGTVRQVDGVASAWNMHLWLSAAAPAKAKQASGSVAR